AFNLAQSLLKTTVELHTEVDFLPALADRFTGLLEQLQENVSHCADTPAGISVPDEETHARLTRRYTMEQEREVHHRLLTLIPGGNPGPGSTPVGTGTIRLVTPGAVVADKDDNADDIDGFELFGTADGNDTGAEDIELFDSGPAGIPTPTAATKEVGSIELFDENIELFDDEPAPAAAKPPHEDPEKTPAAATNSKTGPNAGEPDDDFGDNVELF
ncbi:MAG: hypothetical protein JW781_09435, partial [Deltaproteobacteria bacterium]|nr:hypothetical protein [Candidatus Anaeroferrophillacea bacterium]